MASELRLFTCVMGGPIFCDGNSFFRFRDLSGSLIGTSADDSLAQPSLTKSQSEDDQLMDKLEEFKQCVTVRNRSYRGKTYDSVFVGEGEFETVELVHIWLPLVVSLCSMGTPADFLWYL